MDTTRSDADTDDHPLSSARLVQNTKPRSSCPSSRAGYALALQRRAERRLRARERYLKRNWASNIEIDDAWFLDEDYDTDLESEFVDHRKSYSAEELYTEICETLNVIPSHYFLRHFDDAVMRIPYQMLGAKGVQALTVPLQLNHSVTTLDLTGNFMGGAGVRHLMKLLTENHFITELILASNKLGHSGAKVLHAGLHDNSSLKKVDLSCNKFSDKDAEYFADMIQNNTTLKELNLSANDFCDKGGEMLAKGLQNNDSLLKLDLSWNHLRLSGAEAFGKALKHNRDLEILNLSMNGFSTPGAKALASGLPHNTSLLHLDISNNRIGLEGCQAFSKALEKPIQLRELMIGLNPITNAGVNNLLKALHKNEDSHLELLDLTGIVIDEATNDTAEGLLSKRPHFSFNVGSVLKYMDQAQMRNTPPKAELQVLLEFMSERNLRPVDVFGDWEDYEKTGYVSREEFISRIEALGTALSRERVAKLAATLVDPGNPGQIFIMGITQAAKEPSNYGEIIESDAEPDDDEGNHSDVDS